MALRNGAPRLRTARKFSRGVGGFWDRVEIGEFDSCWNWTGYLIDGRYGRLGFQGRIVLAHRLAYELCFSSIPEGLDVCHVCDNPLCCNPRHLFLGTHLDNMRDMKKKKRNTFGERHPTAKLTEAQVTEIRSRYASGEGAAKLALEFGLVKRSVNHIIAGDTWKHIAMSFFLLFSPVVAFAESPNWTLFDSRIGAKATEYKGRYDSGSYDDKLSSFYYDYATGMEFLSRRLNDPSLRVAAQKGAQFFADEYAIQYSGFLPGYWNFTSGMRRMYQLTGEDRYRNAVTLTSQNAAFARDSTTEDTRDTAYSREVAYAIRSFLDAEAVGQPRRARLSVLVAHSQSHLEQWTNGTAPYLRPFMVGLTAISLIRASEAGFDPVGIRSRLQAIATKMKAELWQESARAFRYTDRIVADANDMQPAPDLNLLIAPMYAWLGDKEFAGKIFNGGIEQAWLGNIGAMKQFNQNVQFVEEFQQWMQPSPTPSPTPTVVNTPTPLPSPTSSPSPLPSPCQRPATMNSIKKLDTWTKCRMDRLVEINNLIE